MNKKILIISPVATHPSNSGNSRCILSYSEMLIEMGFDVYFLWVADFNSTKEEENLTRAFWKSRLFIFRLNQIHRLIKKFFSLFNFSRTGNYKVDDFYPYGIKRFIKKIQKKEIFDSVIVNYVFFSKIFKFFPYAKRILFTHDVFTDRYRLTGNNWFSVTASEEGKALDRAEFVLAIQENEALFYRSVTSTRVITVFSYFPVNETPFTGKKILLFLGSRNPLNVEAITLFINTVYKELVRLHPGIKLIIGGSICNILKSTINDESIQLFGEVDDLKDFYSLGDIFINPTINGTGLKIKTFEAMSYGKVVISHPHNTEGIFNKEKAPIIIARDADEYIKSAALLFANHDEALRLKMESLKYINEMNSIVRKGFAEAIEA